MKLLNVIVGIVGVFGVYTVADYEFRMRNLGCDYTIESVIQSTATKNITNVITTVHGNYRKVITNTVLDNGQKYSTETIMRPDLASQKGYALEVTYSSGVGTTTKESVIQPRGGTTFYKHREVTLFNGHRCFKYYNVPGNAIYADSEGFIWGSQETNDDGEVSIITYKSYDTTEILAGQFTLNHDVVKIRSDEAIVTPDAREYAKECRDNSGENTYVLELPDMGCDIKMMSETDLFTANGKIITTHSTTIVHGSFVLQTVSDSATWKTSSVLLIRPDKGSKQGKAATYVFDYTTGKCVNTEVKLTNGVDFAIKDTVFIHRDEEYYNGFVCYKYYNDSSIIYYMEKSNGLPRGVIIQGQSATRYVYYDFSSINSTKFTFSGNELQACGSKTGDEINDDVYHNACNPVIDVNSQTTTSTKAKPTTSDVKINSALVIRMSPLMIIMVIIALIA